MLGLVGWGMSAYFLDLRGHVQNSKSSARRAVNVRDRFWDANWRRHSTNTPGHCLKFCQMRRSKSGIPATTRPVFSFLSIPLPSFSASSIASWTTLPIFRVGPAKVANIGTFKARLKLRLSVLIILLTRGDQDSTLCNCSHDLHHCASLALGITLRQHLEDNWDTG